MIEVTHNGMSCWSDSYRQIGYAGIALLSVFGNRNAVRAVWANLVGRKRDGGGIQVGDLYARRIDDELYSTIQAPLGEGTTHMVILLASATQQSNVFEDSFHQIGPNAETRFYTRLTQRCPVPMRSSWREEVWELGLENKLITPLEGHGMTMHHVSTAADKWAPVLKTALLAGRIS